MLSMKFSKSLRYFTDVSWDEQKCFIDCLVDIEQFGSTHGYHLVEEGGQLKIYSSTQLVKQSFRQDFKPLGQVIKQIIDFTPKP
jgi:hypothetical protein